MQPTLPRLSHMLLALHQHLHLPPNLPQPPQNILVSLDESQDLVLNPRLLAKLSYQHLQPPQIMPRHSRKQMMHGLELQAAMHEIEPGRARDVHGGAQLALGEGFGVAEVGGRHAPVGKGDLDVQGHGNDVGDEHKGNAECPGRDAAPEEAVAE